MVKFVENKHTGKEFLKKYTSERSVIFPLFKNRKEHPKLNRLLGAFVFIEDDCYVLMNGHNDCLDVPLEVLTHGTAPKFIFDSKWFIHQMELPNYQSIDVLYHLNQFKSYEYDMMYHNFTKGYKDKDDLSFVPISIILKGIVDFVNENLKYANTEGVGGYDYYNSLVLPEFKKIESNGIPTTYGYEYSLYNNFTTTGRPSNTFGGTNYSALNKSDGSRDFIVSKNGKLVQFDFDGYHVRLIAKIVNEVIPEDSAHEWLGKQYFGKEELTDEDYGNSKKLTFQQLYGGIDAENLEIPFFKKTDEFIKKLYKDFLINGYLETKVGKRIPFQRIDNHNPQKVFNYYLQALETETNTYVIRKLNRLLEGRKTKLVLYTYDSFLFDVDKEEESLIEGITNILDRVSPTDMIMDYSYGNI
jgi:hypothetical protein